MGRDACSLLSAREEPMISTVAIVFPGQGSQQIGMLSELSRQHPHIKTLFEVVSDRLGYDLWKLTQQGPEEKLNQTQHTQVAMLTADVAVYTVLMQRFEFKPSLMAGHSLGEYAALVTAGAMSLPDAAALVSLRGQLMQDTVPLGQGAMAAIVGLPDDKVEALCLQASLGSENVSSANYNAVGQVVIAGHTTAVVRAMALAETLGARLAVRIPVSVPCHCPLLMPMVQPFQSALQQMVLSTPTTPIISNVDLSLYESPEHIRHLLAQQLHRPVRWVETIQVMKTSGIDTVIECGPGQILSGLIKRIDRTLTTFPVNDSVGLERCATQIELKRKSLS